MRQPLSPDSTERLFQRTWKSRMRSIPAEKRQQMTIVTQNFQKSDHMFYKLPKYKSWKWQSSPKIELWILINIWQVLVGSKKHDIMDFNFWCFFASLRLFKVRSFVGNLGVFSMIHSPSWNSASLFILIYSFFGPNVAFFAPFFARS